MEALLNLLIAAGLPAVAAIIKMANEQKALTDEQIQSAIDDLRKSQAETGAITDEIESDPALTDLVAKRHGGSTAATSATQELPPPAESR